MASLNSDFDSYEKQAYDHSLGVDYSQSQGWVMERTPKPKVFGAPDTPLPAGGGSGSGGAHGLRLGGNLGGGAGGSGGGAGGSGGGSAGVGNLTLANEESETAKVLMRQESNVSSQIGTPVNNYHYTYEHQHRDSVGDGGDNMDENNNNNNTQQINYSQHKHQFSQYSSTSPAAYYGHMNRFSSESPSAATAANTHREKSLSSQLSQQARNLSQTGILYNRGQSYDLDEVNCSLKKIKK